MCPQTRSVRRHEVSADTSVRRHDENSVRGHKAHRAGELGRCQWTRRKQLIWCPSLDTRSFQQLLCRRLFSWSTTQASAFCAMVISSCSSSKPLSRQWLKRAAKKTCLQQNGKLIRLFCWLQSFWTLSSQGQPAALRPKTVGIAFRKFCV